MSFWDKLTLAARYAAHAARAARKQGRGGSAAGAESGVVDGETPLPPLPARQERRDPWRPVETDGSQYFSRGDISLIATPVPGREAVRVRLFQGTQVLADHVGPTAWTTLQEIAAAPGFAELAGRLSDSDDAFLPLWGSACVLIHDREVRAWRGEMRAAREALAGYQAQYARDRRGAA